MPLLKKTQAFIIIARAIPQLSEDEAQIASKVLDRGVEQDVKSGSMDPWIEVSLSEYEVFRKYEPSLPEACRECLQTEHHKMSCSTGGMKNQRVTLPMRLVTEGTSTLEVRLQEAHAKIRRQRYHLRKQQKLLHAFIRENWDVGYARETEWVQKMERVMKERDEARELAKQFAGDPNSLPWVGE